MHKKGIFLTTLALLAAMLACNLPAAGPRLATRTAPLPTVSVTPLPPPTATIAIPEGVPIEPYQDVRGLDFSTYAVEFDRALIETLWFNGSTRWPGSSGQVAQAVMEAGKNPGLGIRSLHEQGITGAGVNVAIIDQNLLQDHPEYRGKIVEYIDIGTNMPADASSMHGPAVASLLVGETTGTAPGARLYYVAAPSWTADAQYYAEALEWIIARNEQLPEGQKIRVVSVSAAPSGPGTPFTKNNAAWDQAYERAMAEGILVLDCTETYGIVSACYYDLADPENAARCIPGWPGRGYNLIPGEIHAPSSRRTSAEEYSPGVYSYQYTGEGGLSWAIPYVAGVLALGWQIQPDLDYNRMLELVFASAATRPDGALIIDPLTFVEMVRQESDR